MSMTETSPSWPASSRAMPHQRPRQRDALADELADVGAQQRAEIDVAERVVGTCWLTTRIISSGVTPLAASAAMNEPALVPT